MQGSVFPNHWIIQFCKIYHNINIAQNMILMFYLIRFCKTAIVLLGEFIGAIITGLVVT